MILWTRSFHRWHKITKNEKLTSVHHIPALKLAFQIVITISIAQEHWNAVRLDVDDSVKDRVIRSATRSACGEQYAKSLMVVQAALILQILVRTSNIFDTNFELSFVCLFFCQCFLKIKDLLCSWLPLYKWLWKHSLRTTQLIVSCTRNTVDISFRKYTSTFHALSRSY